MSKTYLYRRRNGSYEYFVVVDWTKETRTHGFTNLKDLNTPFDMTTNPRKFGEYKAYYPTPLEYLT